MKKTVNIIFNMFFITLGLGIVGGAVWYAAFSKQLTVQKIVITGNYFLESDTLEDVVSGYKGELLSSLDVGELQRSLKQIDYIREVVVSRRFPSTIIVDILENTPLAVISCSDGKVTIDSAGEILPLTAGVNAYFELPVVTGITDQYAVGELMSDSTKGTLNEVLRIVNCLYTDCDSLLTWVSAINISREYVQFKNNTRRPTAITFNRDDFFDNTAVLNAFTNTLSPKFKLEDFEYINLTIPNQIIVKEKRT